MMTNNQAEAYAKLAMKGVGVDDETIEQVLQEMYHLFDRITEEEAEDQARSSR